MFISLTRLRVRSWWVLPEFLWRSRSSTVQASQSNGFLGGFLLVDRRRAFWTVTGWESEAAMRAYRGSGAHKAVMPKLADWCDEAVVAHFESDAFPSWTEAWEKLKTGRFTPVKHPSRSQQEKTIPPPRTTPLIQQVIKTR